MFNLKKELIKSIVPSAVMCTLISFAVNYFILPMPTDIKGNAIGNGISGFFSGVISAAITTILLVKAANSYINSKKKD